MNVSVKSGRKEVYQPLLINMGSLLGFLSLGFILPTTVFIINCKELVTAITELLEAIMRLRDVWQEFLKQIKTVDNFGEFDSFKLKTRLTTVLNGRSD
ncbi:hypothetical protein [Ligilactobacillus salivarius]|uniref:hypothetical protein n=1 Tax=Ligilactobacillus salivarius TaxID=1624 RepID=UPI0024BADCA3|nr:hypothetical protein [Ligilactobacillus salivarius]